MKTRQDLLRQSNLKAWEKYILKHINSDGYDFDITKESNGVKVDFLKADVQRVTDYMNKGKKEELIAEYYSGLPGIVSLHYWNYDILRLYRRIEGKKLSRNDEVIILNHWFWFLARVTMNLFRNETGSIFSK